MKTQIAIDKFGRVILPKAVRQHMGLTPGDKLKVEEKDNAIVLSLLKQKNCVKRNGKTLVFSGKITDLSTDPLIDVRESRLDDLQ